MITVDSILITGPPAAGKSMIREFLSREAKLRPAGALDIGVDDILREMAYSGEIAKEETCADPNGALILKEPGRHVPVALRRLFDRWSSMPAGAIVEAPLDRVFLSSLVDSGELANRTAVIVLDAPLRVRLERNAARTYGRISELGLKRMDAALSPQVLHGLRVVVPVLEIIDTTAELKDLARKCARILGLTAVGDEAGAIGDLRAK